MTEKKFWTEIWERAGQGAHGERLADFAVKAAKEAGAKFDPEPVELPKLSAWWDIAAKAGRLSTLYTAHPLTIDQAEEAARRCNAWDELRQLAADCRYYDIEKILGVKR